MSNKPSYEELEKRVQELERIITHSGGPSSLFEDSCGHPYSKEAAPPDLCTFELSDIIDAKAIQALMDDFYALTGIGVAVLDLNGKILVSTGWQDVCTKFHRVHPESQKNCLESDLELSSDVMPGEFKLYRCKNNMWDMATPIMVGDRKVGNLFLGQFLFEDESPDIALFRHQAEIYGFDEEKYIEALNRVPRWSRATVETVMRFYTQLAGLFSLIGYNNLILSQTITQKDKLLSDLKESEKRFKALHNASFGGIAIHDNGVILECNRGMSHLTGYTYDELIGKKLLQLIAVENREDVEKYIGTACEKPCEAMGARKSGGLYPLMLEARNIPYRGKNATVIEFRDITEQKRAEEEKRNLEEKLRQAYKMEAIGTLAGGVAHEFNNMLGVIIGNAELAVDDIPEWHPAADCIQEIRIASLRAKDVVRKLLSVARKSPESRKRIQIRPIVEESLHLLRKTMPASIEIRSDFACADEMVFADPTEISQVLMNLCTNSAHAMVDGKGSLEVTLETERFDSRYVDSVKTSGSGDYVKLTVSDDGVGISPDILDRIFEPYFTTKDVGEGLGMGLAVVHGIVKKHEGIIKVQSEIRKGTTVEVRLPVIDAQPTPGDEETDAPGAGTERILFVDDESSMVKMATQMLTRSGYEVVGRTSSRDALNLFKKNPEGLDLVITDMTMPEMTGDELARRIIQIRPDIPIILCTGHSDLMDETRAAAVGVKAFAMKPLTKSDLSATVRKVLDE